MTDTIDLQQNQADMEWRAFYDAGSGRFVTYWVQYIQNHAQDHALLDLDRENILRALETAADNQMPTAFIAGVLALYTYLNVRGLYTLGSTLCQQVADTAQNINDSRNQVWALHRLAAFTGKRGDPYLSKQYLQTCLPIAQQLADQNLIRGTLHSLGTASFLLGDHEAATTYWQQSLELAEALADQNNISTLHQNLGLLAHHHAEYEKAFYHMEKGLAMARQQGNLKIVSDSLINLGLVALALGRFEQAEAYTQEAQDGARQIGHQENMGVAHNNLGEMARLRHAYTLARNHGQEALKIGTRLEHSSILASAHITLGLIETAVHNLSAALPHYDMALQIARAASDPMLSSLVLHPYGEYYLQLGDLDRAQTCFAEAQAEAEKFAGKVLIAQALHGQAQVALARGHRRQAKSFTQACIHILEPTGHYFLAEVHAWLQENLYSDKEGVIHEPGSNH